MIDRYAKIVLTIIAAGLWANVLLPSFRSMPVDAQDATAILRSIDGHLSALSDGVCENRKLCGPSP